MLALAIKTDMPNVQSATATHPFRELNLTTWTVQKKSYTDTAIASPVEDIQQYK